ncbi:MAG: glycerol-3-phosphate 1-O-acyltransferase PlsY [Rickettsiales bacterium]|nr:glycerol-3-phosphate 1-O-acyltransferase PlsY [Rickettsiales bacterium]
MTLNYLWIFETFTFAYFLGSIPFGLLLTRAAGLGDVRKIGSGNIGATNVMRTGHKKIGVATLLLDAGKGFLAVWFAQYMFNPSFSALAGFIVVIGHVFPVWLRFKGGKGVATTIGVFFALDWVLGASVCVMWLIAFLMTRISSVSALLSICYSSIAAYLVADAEVAVLCLTLAGLVLFTHRGNIKRLLEGTEHHFTSRT